VLSVDVHEDRLRPCRCRRSGPHLIAHFGHGFCDTCTTRRRDLGRNVRATVASDGTDPNRSSPMRRCSMSRQLSPPPANMSADWTSTFPRSWRGRPLPSHGMREDSASPSPNRSPKCPRAWSPTWATTPIPPDSTTTRRVLLPFIMEVPFCLGILLSRQQQFPLLEGLFRGGALVRSNAGVHRRGQSLWTTRSPL